MTSTAFRRSCCAVAALLLVATMLASCGGDDAKKGTAESDITIVDKRGKASGGQYPEVKVDVVDDNFSPEGIRIDPGVTVAWHNSGRSVHDIVAVSPKQSFGSKPFGTDALSAGDEYEYTFQKPGVYRYYCALHGTAHQGMVGVVVVGDADVTTGKVAAGGGTKGGTLHVPSDFPSIQAAVDASAPGALILIDVGVYHEAVSVGAGHENLTIRGVDRNRVVLDGQHDKAKPNGFLVQADGVAIENLTAQNYTTNAFFWRGVSGYRGSYLTSYRTGDYGLYAFDSVNGQFDHDYASGSRDAGYYIGQCYPCNAVISDSIAEWNGLGYSGTNAGGNLLIVNSTWRSNRAGIVPNSETGELLYPQRSATIVGNRVYSNNNVKTPAIDIATTALGNGILVAGGRNNVVERNLVYDHDIYGVAAIPLPERFLDPDNAKAIDFNPMRNSFRDNDVSESRTADIALVPSITSLTDTGGNCFSGNHFTTESPEGLQQLVPCGAAASPSFKSELGEFVGIFTATKPKEVDYRTAPIPPLPTDLESMANAEDAPAKPAKHSAVPMKINLDAITTPTR